MRRHALPMLSAIPLLMLLAGLPAVATPTASVLPSSIDSMTAGEVLVSASGLGGTEMRVTLWADVDGDGIVDAEDYAVWRDIVPDNVAEWSPVMAADEDPAAGSIAISARAFKRTASLFPGSSAIASARAAIASAGWSLS